MPPFRTLFTLGAVLLSSWGGASEEAPRCGKPLSADDPPASKPVLRLGQPLPTEYDHFDDHIYFTHSPISGGYSTARRVLFLADGLYGEAMGPSVAKAFPSLLVTSSDVLHGAPKTVGNLTTMRIDHKEGIPAPDNSYDRIVLRNALCVCNRTRFCADIPFDAASAATFFLEIGRVLDKNDPVAGAFLHGCKITDPDNHGTVLRDAAALTMERNPALRVMVIGDVTGRVIGVTLRPALVP